MFTTSEIFHSFSPFFSLPPIPSSFPSLGRLPMRFPDYFPTLFCLLLGSLLMPSQAALGLQSTPIGPSIFSLLPAQRPLISHTQIDTVGITFRDSLTTTDYLLDGSLRVAAWRIQLLERTPYQLTLMSQNLDSFLYVTSPISSFRDESSFATTADPNADSPTHICFTPLVTANYIVVVSAFDDATGPYDLHITRDCNDASDDLLNLQIPTDHRLPVGYEVESHLTSTDAQWDDKPIEGWLLQLAADDSLSITVDSDAFDPYLIVIDSTGQRMDDDDGGPGLSARLVLSSSVRRNYRILVTSYSGGIGSFRIAVLRFRRFLH